MSYRLPHGGSPHSDRFKVAKNGEAQSSLTVSNRQQNGMTAKKGARALRFLTRKKESCFPISQEKMFSKSILAAIGAIGLVSQAVSAAHVIHAPLSTIQHAISTSAAPFASHLACVSKKHDGPYDAHSSKICHSSSHPPSHRPPRATRQSDHSCPSCQLLVPTMAC